MNGNYSTSPEEASATGRPDRDTLATQDDPAKCLTQDKLTKDKDDSERLVTSATRPAAVWRGRRLGICLIGWWPFKVSGAATNFDTGVT